MGKKIYREPPYCGQHQTSKSDQTCDRQPSTLGGSDRKKPPDPGLSAPENILVDLSEDSNQVAIAQGKLGTSSFVNFVVVNSGAEDRSAAITTITRRFSQPVYSLLAALSPREQRWQSGRQHQDARRRMPEEGLAAGQAVTYWDSCEGFLSL